MNKKRLISACFALLLGISFSASLDKDIINVEANYMKYDLLSQLEESSDAIIIGKALKDFDDREHKLSFFDDGTLEDFYTLTDIEVSKVFKSNFNDISENQKIEIVEPVSLKGNDIITYSGYRPLKEKEEYIIFLAKNSYGQYSIINMQEGVFSYNVSQSDTLKLDDNSLYGEVYKKYITK